MALPPARPRRIGALLLALLIGGWLAAFGFTIGSLHTKALDERLSTAYTHTRNFEEHLTQTLQVIDLIATNLDPGTSAKLKPDEMSTLAKIALRPAPYLRSLSLLDAEGRVIGSSAKQNLGQRVDLGDFFPVGDPRAEVLRIGAPRPGRDISDNAAASQTLPLTPTAVNVIPVLRRLPGQPARWILASINPDYFINHFAQLLDPHEGRVQLLRYDGLLLASSGLNDPPGAKEVAGDVTRRLEQGEFGRFEQTLGDGRRVLSAYRASSRFPALIAVHIDREQALAAWRAESQHMAVIFLPALAALSIAGLLALRRQARIAVEDAERHRQARLSASVFDSSNDAIVLTLPNEEIISCNPAFQRITGYEKADVLGKTPRLLQSGQQNAEFYRDMWASIIRDGRWQGELVNRRKDGSLFTALVSINAVRNEAGEFQHYVGVTSDITERKRAQAAEREAALKLQQETVEKMLLREQTIRDALTGLYNRRYLDETLPREIARAKREGYPLAVIMVDIDHFKKINDTYGHPAGDEVIRILGRILSEGAREGDVVCRYGGEEFVVALPRMDLDAAVARAEKWRLTAAEYCVRHGELEIRFSLSAGVANFPTHHADTDALLQCADSALYRSKNDGRNRVTLYEPQVQIFRRST